MLTNPLETTHAIKPSLHTHPSLAEIGLCGQKVNPWTPTSLGKVIFKLRTSLEKK